MPVYFAYYAGIMLDAFGFLLCFLLCWHNRPRPSLDFVMLATDYSELAIQF